MWRRHQSVQSTVQRWLYGHHRTSSVGIGTHHLLPSSSIRSVHRGVASSGASNLSSPQSWPSVALSARSDVSHPSLKQPTLISCHAFSTSRGKRNTGSRRGPDFRNYDSVEEIIDAAYHNLDVMSRRDVSAFWTCILKLMTRRDNQTNQLPKLPVDGRLMMRKIFDNTVNGIEDCNMKELTQTTVSMAKIVQILLRKRAEGRGGEDAYRIVLRELLLNKDNRTANRELFQVFAQKTMDILHEFDARHISNLAYAYALIEYVPKFGDGNDLFEHIAMQSIKMRAEFAGQNLSNTMWAFATVDKRHDELFKAMGDEVDARDHLRDFRPQHLSNIVWAYATAQISHPDLFEKVGNHIVGLKSLDRFTHPQDVSNTVWAYATAGVNHPQLFEKMANHIVRLDNLRRLDPQAISNTVWAYATAGVNHPQLFEKVAKHIVNLDYLNFDPQALSNTVWAYATAGVNHPNLFEKMANHIAQLDHLRDFRPQALSNIVWAYATAQVSHQKLFQQVAKAAIQQKEELISQAVANLLWSYATMGIIDKQLFSSFVPTAAKLIDNFNNQNLANIAWAYAVADIDVPTLFNDRFINKCLEKEDGFSTEALLQLHQWHLWRTKEKSRTGLPEELQDRCYKAFFSEEASPSKLQDDVVEQLSSIGLDPKEEELLDSGYRIDAITEVNGKTIGVEVDGPSHFIGKSKSPLAKTILKRRQVPSIDGIELVSVPYWEWNKLGKSQTKKQEYLRQLLGLGLGDD